MIIRFVGILICICNAMKINFAKNMMIEVKTIVDRNGIESTADVYLTIPLYNLNTKKEMAVKVMQNKNSIEKSVFEKESTVKLLCRGNATRKAQAETAMSDVKIIQLGTVMI